MTLLVIFFMPCLATLVVIRKEMSSKALLAIMSITITIAFISTLFARLVAGIIL